RVRIINRRFFADVSDLELRWRAWSGGLEVASGRADLPAIGPQADGEVRIDLPSGPLDLEAILVLRQPTAWAEAGHEIHGRTSEAAAWPTVLVTAPADLAEPSTRVAEFGPWRAELGPGGTGLRRLDLNGAPVLEAGPRLGLYRAPTDNDEPAWGLSLGRSWRETALDRLVSRVVSSGERRTDESLELWSEVRWAPVARAYGVLLTTRLSLTAAGLEVAALGVPVGEWPFSWGRFGLDLELPDDWDRVDWYGSGPGESYPDMRAGVRRARWSSSVDGLQAPNVRPQENGNREDLSWLELSGVGPKFRIEALSPLSWTLRPWTDRDLDEATHRHELTRSGRLHLSLNGGQSGVGSGSCGPDLPPEWQLTARPLTVAFRITLPE
ncbi:MAG: DUF4981 domain-containing protein, partial [Fimbriimonadaceae bacterium]|nr:DUF4981 domain-containing protein [Fimbriimonadaceae bacterium]